MIKTILFDLDGTLLSMDVEQFTGLYFTTLCDAVKCLEIDSDTTKHAMGKGLRAIYSNDGSTTNEVVFWNAFEQVTKCNKNDLENCLNDYYANKFIDTLVSCKPNEYSQKIVNLLKSKGVNLILATNPLFPYMATHKRIECANLKVDDFSEITTYENYHYCKPNVNYFKEIIKNNDLNVDEIMMVGNDAKEDYAISELGVRFCLITDELIGDNQNVECEFKGSLKEFYEYLIENFD